MNLKRIWRSFVNVVVRVLTGKSLNKQITDTVDEIFSLTGQSMSISQLRTSVLAAGNSAKAERDSKYGEANKLRTRLKKAFDDAMKAAQDALNTGMVEVSNYEQAAQEANERARKAEDILAATE